MNWRIALGVVLFACGVAVIPFGWWLARTYYYAGFLIAALGGALAFSGYKLRNAEPGHWSPPNDPIVPVTGEARGFKGRDAFERGDDHGAGDATD